MSTSLDNPITDCPDSLIYSPIAGRYSSDHFYGIVIDTGAAFTSTAGYGQFLALQKVQHVNIKETANGQRFKFGIGSTTSKGTVEVNTPLGSLVFHVVEADTPFLLSLNDLDKTGAYFNNLTNQLVRKDQSWPVIRKYGHPFLIWGKTLSSYCTTIFFNSEDVPLEGQLTEKELRQLHRRFGHPSIDRLTKLLSKSNHQFDRQALEQIHQFCHQCQTHAKPPSRFRFSIKDDAQFNLSIVIDIMYLGTPTTPALHIVDEATRFQAARFLKDVSTAHVWDALRSAWIDTYIGPPDFIIHDAGTQFTSSEFKQNATSMGSTTKCVPIEAHHSIGLVERYHTPLRRAFDIITEELPNTAKQHVLQMAVKTVNDTVGPDGLVLTLLVFGTYPRMTVSDSPSPTITERGKAIAKAMKHVAELYAKRQVKDALNLRNGPNTSSTLDIPIGGDVLVYRENKGWKGPYTLLSTDGQVCTVSLPSGPTKFRIISVKKYFSDHRSEEEGATDTAVTQAQEDDHSQDDDQTRQNPPRDRRLPRRYQEIDMSELCITTTASQPFAVSRQKEIDGLLNQGVFQIVHIDDIPPNERLFGSRFVDTVKYKDGVPFEKSRLVVQAYHDSGKKQVLTQAPTIQRSSQRLILCLTASFPDRNLYIRDISQAYVQSKSYLNRRFYVKPPKELDLGNGNILRVLRPLYGVPEAGTHWFRTYHAHHINELKLLTSAYDPCLLYNKDAVVALQTDDTLFLGNLEYVATEETQLQKAGYLAKPIEKLSVSKKLVFNGGTISKEHSTIRLTQEKHCTKIRLVQDKNLKAMYIQERVRGVYIASTC